jgi:hypothetical protein
MLKWEMQGAFFIALAGALNHFIYEWTGRNGIAAVFSAVNESTWEHLKMGFWPYFIWAVAGYFKYGRGRSLYFLAKSAGAAAYCVLICAVYYCTLAVFHRHLSWAGIISFFLAVFIGQYVSYAVAAVKLESKAASAAGAALFVIITLCFALFTYFTPRFFLFLDPANGGYGISAG